MKKIYQFCFFIIYAVGIFEIIYGYFNWKFVFYNEGVRNTMMLTNFFVIFTCYRTQLAMKYNDEVTLNEVGIIIASIIYLTYRGLQLFN